MHKNQLMFTTALRADFPYQARDRALEDLHIWLDEQEALYKSVKIQSLSVSGQAVFKEENMGEGAFPVIDYEASVTAVVNVKGRRKNAKQTDEPVP